MLETDFNPEPSKDSCLHPCHALWAKDSGQYPAECGGTLGDMGRRNWGSDKMVILG
jgi:hypothetical protein